MLQIDCPSTLPTDCKIIFVGEGPGLEEARQGEGWVGPAGKCLQRAVGLAGIDWSIVGKTNVTKRYTGKVPFTEAFYEIVEEPIYTKTGKLSKKTKKIIHPTQEWHEWVNILVSEIKSTNPNLVVACGNEALEAITGLSGITNYRGSVLPGCARKKVLAVEHPSYILKGQMQDFWLLVHDLKKAKREMEFSEIRREPIDLIPDPSYDEILERLWWLDEHPTEHWTLDFETHKYTGTVKCFAIGYELEGRITAFAVGIQNTTGPVWLPDQELHIWSALRRMARVNPFYSNQNAPFDIYYMLRYGVEPSGVWMDTMLVQSVLEPELPKSLAFQLSWYFDDIAYYKSDNEDFGYNYPFPELKLYCCKDAAYTRRLVPKLDKGLKQKGLFRAYHGNI